MTITRRTALASAAALPFAATAQPIAGGRSIRLIVPFPPGGAVDISARLIADRLPPLLGNSVVVENRSGAGGLVGSEAVAKSAPDGTTLGLLGVSVFCAYPFLYSRLPFDPAKDFTPVSQITTGTVMCVVNAETAARNGWTDFRTLIAWSKAHPERVRMGSSGNGTTSHFVVSSINDLADARILHVPYRGGGPAINDLLAGTIDMMFDVMPALMPHVRSGKFRALAVGSAKRLPILPDIPGMSEFGDLGLAGMDVQSWSAITGPAGMPDEVVNRLHAAVVAVGRDRDFGAKLAPLGYDPIVSESPAALRAQIAQDTPRWKALVEASGAKLD